MTFKRLTSGLTQKITPTAGLLFVEFGQLAEVERFDPMIKASLISKGEVKSSDDDFVTITN